MAKRAAEGPEEETGPPGDEDGTEEERGEDGGYEEGCGERYTDKSVRGGVGGGILRNRKGIEFQRNLAVIHRVIESCGNKAKEGGGEGDVDPAKGTGITPGDGEVDFPGEDTGRNCGKFAGLEIGFEAADAFAVGPADSGSGEFVAVEGLAALGAAGVGRIAEVVGAVRAEEGGRFVRE